MTILQRLLKPIVDVRKEEALTALLMFLYSFLAMTSYNILKPITRSKFISDLGADNLPYVLLAAGVLIGVIMQGYSRGTALLPRKWVVPAAQASAAGLLVVFWFLFQTGATWVPVAFYLFGLILGILLISQFWTIANDIFDPRQAKRLFGFIGGGASLGGIMGSSILQFAQQVGTNNLLLVSAAILAVCIFVVAAILRQRRDVELSDLGAAAEEKGVSGGEAFRLIRESKHLQIIALVIGFAAIGAQIIEQQLNMAAEAARGQENTDAITALLGQVQLYLSISGFVIQVWLTSKIQRNLGVGFALLLLPVALGSTGLVILATGALWAPMMARVFDTSLRYTVDKTTREILFLPLPTDIKYQAKPFVDVTVDRFAKGIGALITLVLIKDWGLNFDWVQLSYASLALMALWFVAAIAAKRGYLAAFRRSIERRDVRAAEVRLDVADLSTVETLVEELANPDEQRVLYAIDILESLEKRNLVTPLLLYHESPRVRARALEAMAEARPEIARRWLPSIERMLSDPDRRVRAAAVSALSNINEATVFDLVRPHLDDDDPRIQSTAATVLARSERDDDVDRAEAALARLAADSSDANAAARRDVAAAIGQIGRERFHVLLIPLLYDADPGVAEEAMRSVRRLGTSSSIFVPTLVSLLRNRRLKGAAREVLVGYGEPVVDALAHFLADPDEDAWVRRHIPATLARIPCQRSMTALSDMLKAADDGFLRYKLVSAIDKLHREHPALTFDRGGLEALALREGRRYFECLGLHYNLFVRERLPADALLARTLLDKVERSQQRIFTLLGLLYRWQDISAARWAIQKGDAKARSSALEYLDNVLQGQVRKRLLPVLEDAPLEEKVRRGNVFLKTRTRNAEETLLQLINDDDQVVAACAINLVAQQKIWALADDIEHVLAHRDARDWYVFEAASWALADYRLPDNRRRQLWIEPLPAVEIAERLSAMPAFRNVWVDEVIRIAGTGRQVRHDAGTVLYQEGAPPGHLQVLLDGRVTVRTRSGHTRELAPPAPLGLEEVFQGAPMASSIRTTETTVCLSLTSDECRMLMADNPELVEGLFGAILAGQAFASGRVRLRGEGAADLSRLADEGVKPVERVLALQSISLFADVSTEELLKLADVARPLVFIEGETLFDVTDTPSVFVVLDGRISLEVDGADPVVADRADAIGVYETLAGVPVGRVARVVERGAALVIDHDDLFDLLGHRPELIQQLFSVLFARQDATSPLVTSEA